MSTFWKVMVGLLLTLPIGAYVTGSLVASEAEMPSERTPIVISDVPSDEASNSKRPDSSEKEKSPGKTQSPAILPRSTGVVARAVVGPVLRPVAGAVTLAVAGPVARVVSTAQVAVTAHPREVAAGVVVDRRGWRQCCANGCRVNASRRCCHCRRHRRPAPAR